MNVELEQDPEDYNIQPVNPNDYIGARYTSVWEDGSQITTPCKINLNTQHVIDIQDSNDDSDHGCLIDEFVEHFVPNGWVHLGKDELMLDYKED